MKGRGLNMLRKKIGNTHPKDLIKTFSLFEGDLVEVIGGRRDVGKQGILLSILRDKNLVVVADVATQVKHLKPNPFYPKGDRIIRPTPIPYSNVNLVDPTINKAVKVSLGTMYDPEKKREIQVRFSKETRTPIYLPEKKDIYKDRAEGKFDTKADKVEQITWRPDLNSPPFPTVLMNELERMERRGRTAQAI